MACFRFLCKKPATTAQAKETTLITATATVAKIHTKNKLQSQFSLKLIFSHKFGIT